MEKVLLKVYDHNDYLTNILVPLSMDYQKIIFLSRHKYKERPKKALYNYLLRKNIKSDFVILKNDAIELSKLLEIYKESDVDISGSHYLSLYLFEKTINDNRKILYFDNEECSIKDYKSHDVINDKLYGLNIEEMIALSGANLIKNMHIAPDLKNKVDNQIIVDIVDRNIGNYHAFTNFISHIMQIIANKNSLNIKISQKDINYISSNQIFDIIKDFKVIWLENDVLKFKNQFFLELFRNAGAWLESYLYIKINNSKQFDDCVMSAIIEFKDKEIRYPISCEIDVIAIKNNRMALISCKSNKVDADAVNEIKVHNTVFGNYLSKPVISTIEDINVKNPTIYKKSQELEVSIIDETAIKNNAVSLVLNKILNGTYEYEKVK